jgi:hypothetical protein
MNPRCFLGSTSTEGRQCKQVLGIGAVALEETHHTRVRRHDVDVDFLFPSRRLARDESGEAQRHEEERFRELHIGRLCGLLFEGGGKV